jgi:hypothetical protein
LVQFLLSFWRREFRFGLQPVFQIVAFCPIALLVYLVSPAADLLLQKFGGAGWLGFYLLGG